MSVRILKEIRLHLEGNSLTFFRETIRKNQGNPSTFLRKSLSILKQITWNHEGNPLEVKGNSLYFSMEKQRKSFNFLEKIVKYFEANHLELQRTPIRISKEVS